jgi:hypothetical protein
MLLDDPETAQHGPGRNSCLSVTLFDTASVPQSPMFVMRISVFDKDGVEMGGVWWSMVEYGGVFNPTWTYGAKMGQAWLA